MRVSVLLAALFVIANLSLNNAATAVDGTTANMTKNTYVPMSKRRLGGADYFKSISIHKLYNTSWSWSACSVFAIDVDGDGDVDVPSVGGHSEGDQRHGRHRVGGDRPNVVQHPRVLTRHEQV